MLQFNATREELDLIVKIAKRVEAITPHLTRLTIIMDLEACHSNACPLDLVAMLDSRETDLMHDVCGINRHLDRQTGELMDCFVPRFAAYPNN